MKNSYIIAVFFILTLALQSYPIYLTTSNPFLYHSVIVLTPTVKRGDYFREELDVERFRICKVDIDRFLINKQTRDVIYRERVPGGASSLGRNMAQNKIKIPDDAPLGSAILLQNSSSVCVDGTHTMAWPVVEFEIVE